MECYTPAWKLSSVLAGAVVVLYGLGVPALLVGALWRYNERLYFKDFSNFWGSLYGRYSTQFCWWEVRNHERCCRPRSYYAFSSP